MTAPIPQPQIASPQASWGELSVYLALGSTNASATLSTSRRTPATLRPASVTARLPMRDRGHPCRS